MLIATITTVARINSKTVQRSQRFFPDRPDNISRDKRQLNLKAGFNITCTIAVRSLRSIFKLNCLYYNGRSSSNFVATFAEYCNTRKGL